MPKNTIILLNLLLILGANETYMRNTHKIAFGDGVHLSKSSVLGATNNYVCIGDHMVGFALLEAAYHDSDKSRRDLVREACPLSAIVAKNKFSIQDRVAVATVEVQAALLSAEERASGEVPFVVTIGPTVHHFWRENMPAAYANPSGAHCHYGSGNLIYVDSETCTLRVLHIWHSKAYNDILLKFPGSCLLVDVTMIDTQVYITCSGRDPCVFTIDLASVVGRQRNSSAQDHAIDEGEGSQRAVQLPPSAKKEVVKFTTVGDVTSIVAPFSISAPVSGSPFMFMTDSHSKTLLELSVAGGPANALVRQVTSFDVSPRGVACFGPRHCIVAVGNQIVEVKESDADAATSASEVSTKVIFDAPKGVVINSVALRRDHCEIAYVTNEGIHSVSVLQRDSADSDVWKPGFVGGGSTEYSTDGAQEGRAQTVNMWRPSFASYFGRTIIFTHPGCRCIQMITNLALLADTLIPNLRRFQEAFSLTGEAGDAGDLHQMLSKVCIFRRFIDGNRRGNFVRTGRMGGQGGDLNWSNNLHNAVSHVERSLLRVLKRYSDMGVPEELVRALLPVARLTIMVEYSFISMRAQANCGGDNPYLLDCLIHRNSVIEEEAKRHAANNFSYYTGPSKHYNSRSSSAGVIGQVHRVRRPSTTLCGSEREDLLKKLRKGAKRLQGVKQTRPTAKAKYNAGSGPQSLLRGFQPESSANDGGALLSTRGSTEFSMPVASGKARIRHMCHALVLVKAAQGSGVRFFVVQLLDVVAEKKNAGKDRRGGGWKLVNPKPRVRYFDVDLDSTDGDYIYVASTADKSGPPIEGTVNAAAIYGHVTHSSGQIDSSNALLRFEISADEHERCADVISGKEDAYEKSNSDNTESSSEEGSSDEADSDPEGRRVHAVVPQRAEGKRPARALDIRALLGKRAGESGGNQTQKKKRGAR